MNFVLKSILMSEYFTGLMLVLFTQSSDYKSLSLCMFPLVTITMNQPVHRFKHLNALNIFRSSAEYDTRYEYIHMCICGQTDILS